MFRSPRARILLLLLLLLLPLLSFLAPVPPTAAQPAHADPWAAFEGMWRFTIDLPADQEDVAGRMLIVPAGGTYRGLFREGGGLPEFMKVLRLEGATLTLEGMWFWTSDQIRLQVDAGGLKGTWTSSHNRESYPVTLTRVMPVLEGVDVRRTGEDLVELDVRGQDLPAASGPYRIYGVVRVRDPALSVTSARILENGVLRVDLGGASGAELGSKHLVVNGASIAWTLPPAPARPETVGFVTPADGRFDAIDLLTYDWPFAIEVRYHKPPADPQRAVQVETGTGPAREVPVRRTADAALYRSEALRLRPPGGSGPALPIAAGGMLVARAGDATARVPVQDVIRVFNRVSTRPSGEFGNPVMEARVLQPESPSFSSIPSRVAPEFSRTVTFRNGEQWMLSGDPSGVAAWSVDNFLLVQLSTGGRTLSFHVGETRSAVELGRSTLLRFGPPGLSQPPFLLSAFAPKDVPVQVRIRALDYGGEGGVGNVFLVKLGEAKPPREALPANGKVKSLGMLGNRAIPESAARKCGCDAITLARVEEMDFDASRGRLKAPRRVYDIDRIDGAPYATGLRFRTRQNRDQVCFYFTYPAELAYIGEGRDACPNTVRIRYPHAGSSAGYRQNDWSLFSLQGLGMMATNADNTVCINLAGNDRERMPPGEGEVSWSVLGTECGRVPFQVTDQ